MGMVRVVDQSLVIGHWSLVIGHWSLVIGEEHEMSDAYLPMTDD
jgi:hypothetical protein